MTTFAIRLPVRPRKRAPVQVISVFDPAISLTLSAHFGTADGLLCIGPRYAAELHHLEVPFSVFPRGEIESGQPRDVTLALAGRLNGTFGRNLVMVSHEVEPDPISSSEARRFRITMYEATRPPAHWIAAYNANPDCVLLVPDEWLREAYLDSGVKAPIAVVPLGVELADLNPPRVTDVFTFGMCAQFDDRKNHLALIRAFKLAFQRESDVRLMIHGRFGHLEESVRRAAEGDARISVTAGRLNAAALERWWQALDAYVLPSSGEGFSHTPREALLRGLPTAVSNYSAHRKLVNADIVVPIETNGLMPAYASTLGTACGLNARIEPDAVAQALRWIYMNRERAQRQALDGRSYVMQNDLWVHSTQALLRTIAEYS